MADYSFPFGEALELLLSCFTGTVASKINSFQQQLQKTDIVSQHDDKQHVKTLNNLESQAWLYKGILERLGSVPSTNQERVAKTLEALEYKSSEISRELEPIRPRRYRVLAGIQDSARIFFASQAEKDYERIEKVVSNLVLFASSRRPSQLIISEVINELSSEIAQNSNQISPYRLRLIYKLNGLMDAISSRLLLGSTGDETNSDYQSAIDELRSQVRLLSREFNRLLQTRQKNITEANRSAQRVSDLTRDISYLYRDLSNRDICIENLRRNAFDLTTLKRQKDEQINKLQNSISELKRSIQSSIDTNQSKQSQIDYLKRGASNRWGRACQ